MLPFVLPFALYLGLTALAASRDDHYALMYTAAVLVCIAALVWAVPRVRAFRISGRILPAVGAGVLGAFVWIVLARWAPEAELVRFLPSFFQPSQRAAFDPFQNLSPYSWALGFTVIRFIGLTFVTPLAEEIFWRGFVMRWLNGKNWDQEPLGRFTWFSFSGVTLLFTLAHPEWTAAAVYCAGMNLFFYWRKNLFELAVAHGVTNLGLGIYVLKTASWHLW